MHDAVARSLTLLVMVGMVIQLAVIFYVLNGQHDGCERSKLDRGANAQGWRTAQTARLQTLAEEEDISYEETKRLLLIEQKPGEPHNLTAARQYEVTADGLEKRSRVSCPGDFLGGIL